MSTKRFAFTMIELIFSIVILGIIGKFGVEFLAQAYKSFIFTNVNQKLQVQSEAAIETIAARLQHRIKDSVIVRKTPHGDPEAIGTVSGDDYVIMEWVGIDYEGFRGDSSDATPYLPTWSGILDLDAGDKTALVSPETNTTRIDDLVQILSDGKSTIADSALFFIGADSDILTGYGWTGDTSTVDTQDGAMHPVTSVSGDETKFTSSTSSDFDGTDIYEYYYFAWTAYALVYEAGDNNKGTLRLYWNYQPWLGENYSDTDKDIQNSVVMENVSTFQFTAIGSILKIQVCVKTDLVEEYSICKEKTIF